MSADFVPARIEQIKSLTLDMHGRDFLLTWEKPRDEIVATALVAEALQRLHRDGISFRLFDTGIAVSIFRDKSTRTRFSFASAVNALGLALADMDEEKSQIAHGETVRETANMISFLTEVIGIRDDMYLGEGNRYMREVAAAVQDGFEQGVLPRRPTLVNLQCDIDHPTQAMADLLKIKSYFGSFEALRGRKIAMTWAYSPSYGKPLSVPQGIIGLMTRFGMEVVLAHPDGYDLIPEVEALAARQAAECGGSYTRVTSMEEAFRGADVVYPKSWAPFEVMQRRTELLKARDKKALDDLEKVCLANNSRHRHWECNEANMKLTRGGQALYMHCLPADITGVSCERGEVAAETFDRYRIHTYQEAGFKPFVIAAMILLARCPDPAATLERILSRAQQRFLV
jgi:knotted carbamoyltransferase YgeW